MKKHVSRFHTVLRIRRHQEKVAQQQLRRIQDEHEREQAALNALEGKKEEALDNAVRFGRAKVGQVQVHRAFIFKLNRQIDHQSRKVEEVREREVEQLDELTKRSQSRQMVQKLDERTQEETARRLDKKEQELIDDIAGRAKVV
jgi:flagellar export protein FliJ